MAERHRGKEVGNLKIKQTFKETRAVTMHQTHNSVRIVIPFFLF